MYNWLRKLFRHRHQSTGEITNGLLPQPDPPPHWIYESARVLEWKTGYKQYIVWVIPEQWYALTRQKPTSGVWYTSDGRKWAAI